MLPLLARCESTGEPAAEREYSVSAARTSATSARVTVRCRLRMLSGLSTFRWLVSCSVRVNGGAVQTAPLKGSLSSWSGDSWTPWTTVYDGSVRIGRDDVAVAVVPCIWRPYGGGGDNDLTNWRGESGVWHPFVFGNEEYGRWADEPCPSDAALLDNRGLDFLDCGRLFDAYAGVEPVSRVWSERSEWPWETSGLLRTTVFWEPSAYASEYSVSCSLDGSAPREVARTRGTSVDVTRGDIAGTILPGSRAVFSVTALSGDDSAGPVESAPLSFPASGPVDAEPGGYAISPSRVDASAAGAAIYVSFDVDRDVPWRTWETVPVDPGIGLATWDSAGLMSAGDKSRLDWLTDDAIVAVMRGRASIPEFPDGAPPETSQRHLVEHSLAASVTFAVDGQASLTVDVSPVEGGENVVSRSLGQLLDGMSGRPFDLSDAVPAATAEHAGLMSAGDKRRLDRLTDAAIERIVLGEDVPLPEPKAPDPPEPDFGESDAVHYVQAVVATRVVRRDLAVGGAWEDELPLRFAVVSGVDVVEDPTYGPDRLQIVSTTDSGRVDSVFVDGEDVLVRWSGESDGSYPIARYSLARLSDRGNPVDPVEWPTSACSRSNGMSSFRVSIPAQPRASRRSVFELRAYDSRGRLVYNRHGTLATCRVNVYDGTVFSWTGKEWRRGSLHVWNGASWRLANEVYVDTAKGLKRR